MCPVNCALNTDGENRSPSTDGQRSCKGKKARSRHNIMWKVVCRDWRETPISGGEIELRRLGGEERGRRDDTGSKRPRHKTCNSKTVNKGTVGRGQSTD